MRRYIVFVFGGGLGLVLALLITTVLTEMLGVWYALSYGIGLALGTSFKFAFHRAMTFGNKTKWKKRFARYVAVIVAMNVVNWLLVFAGSEAAAFVFQEEVKAVYYTSTILVVTASLSVVNYFLNRKLVFSD